MPAPRCSDSEFIQIWHDSKSSYEVAKKLNIARRDVMKRRRRLEKKYGALPTLSDHNFKIPDTTSLYDQEGTGVIFSDAHWWPDVESPATSVMLEIISHIQPDFIIANGDILDGAQISRHGRIGWDRRPTVKEELETVQSYMGEIERASKADLYRTIGNHDIRLETYLSERVSPFEGVPGTTLEYYLPKWKECWALNLNNACIVKHRWHGGTHAAYNNVLKGGVSIVTGHTHRLQIRPFSDYRGERYGVECGTLAKPGGPQFDYTECNPLDWQEGFVIAHIDGDQADFETVRVKDGKAKWAGKVWS